MLERNIRHYSDYGNIMVIGDLNARTGLSSDHSESCDNIEKYIHCLEGAELNLDADVSVGRRFSLDTKIESSGVKLLQICKDAGLRILNGRLGEDAGIGNFTFQSSRGKSVIDYVICSPSLFKIVHSFCVHDISTLCTRDTINYLTSETDTTRRGAWFKMESGELTIILILQAFMRGQFGSRVGREIKCTYLCLFAINSILNNISLPQKQ